MYSPTRARARGAWGAGDRNAHTGAVGAARAVGGADLLSGPLDIAPCGAALGRRDRRGPGPRGPPGAGRAGSGARVATGPACGGEAVGGGSVAQEGRPRRGGPCGDPRGGWGPLDTPDTGGRGAPGATLLPATALHRTWFRG